MLQNAPDVEVEGRLSFRVDEGVSGANEDEERHETKGGHGRILERCKPGMPAIPVPPVVDRELPVRRREVEELFLDVTYLRVWLERET